MRKKLILVDKNDNQIGTAEKITAHKEKKLHRCFSVLIFNSKGELLIQQRAKNKYHSALLWSNTCCSHPRPGKDIKKEAQRRLKQEMGIKCDNLKEVFTFTYYADFGELAEQEFDHVFTGNFDGTPKPDKKEVENWKWVDIKELKKDIEKNPKKYTKWFPIILNKLK